MPEKFEILLNYVKDLSSETPDAETYLFVRDNLKSYNLNIDIISKAIKNNLIEVNEFVIDTYVLLEGKEPEFDMYDDF